jgi:preprotein translocase subunit Sec63
MEELRLVPLSEYQADCRLLEVEPGASMDEIRQAYRDQTKVWHPDRFSNDTRLQQKAEERIRQINSAYRRLCGLSPYEQPVFSPVTREASSDWVAVFALRRAVRNSVKQLR